jgi:hypothetical protein
MCAQVISIPVKTFSDGETWLLLDSVLGKRVTIRAHEIKVKNGVEDYDKHHNSEADAKESVKCKSRSWSIADKITSI